MNFYTLALFFHIVGALGLFVSLGLEWTSLHRLRLATTAEQVREWLRVVTGASRVGGASMVLILVAGFTLMALAGISAAWVIVAFWTFVLLAILRAALTGPRLTAVRRAVTAEQGLVSTSLSQRLHHPLLWLSIQTRLALALGIVFLMTVKPELSGALLTVGGATVLGVVSAVFRLSGGRGAEKRTA
jgi:hypothetical protein